MYIHCVKESVILTNYCHLIVVLHFVAKLYHCEKEIKHYVDYYGHLIVVYTTLCSKLYHYEMESVILTIIIIL